MEIYHPQEEELLREMRRVRRSAKRKRLLWGLVIWLALTIAAGLFVFNRYYRLAVMQGPAMGDTLPSGSLVLVRRTTEEDTAYVSGDVLLYEKRMAAPIQITILSPKGKIRDYCEYRVFRDMGTTRQYLLRVDGHVTWITDISKADIFVTDPEGLLTLDTEGLPNGDYFLRETRASYGQNVLDEPIPITVTNPVRTQIKRVLGAKGDGIVLSPYAETRVNGQVLNRALFSGSTSDAGAEARRVIVGDKEYFIQGDQLSLSVDSRDQDTDLVSQEEVLGRVDFVLWPIRAFGPLTGQSVTVAGGGQEAAE